MGGTATEPLLELDFLSHGTVLMDDLDIARRFYEEFLRLEVDQPDLPGHTAQQRHLGGLRCAQQKGAPAGA